MCIFLENTERQGSMDEDSVQAFETLLRIIQIGIQVDSGMDLK